MFSLPFKPQSRNNDTFRFTYVKVNKPQQGILMRIIEGLALPVKSKAKVRANIPAAAATLAAIKMKSTSIESPPCRLLRGEGKRNYWSSGLWVFLCAFSTCISLHQHRLRHHREGSRLSGALEKLGGATWYREREYNVLACDTARKARARGAL